MKKCVVIGSGLGGLSCGAILARNGYEVTVLEQGRQMGGCLQCFRRGEAVFDTGMHYIGSADPGQTLHAIFHYLGIDSKVRLSRLDPQGYDVISFRGSHYRLANGREGFIEALTEQFPDSAAELSSYYDEIRGVALSGAIHSLNRKVDLYKNAAYQLLSVNEVINRNISNPLLREVLVGTQLLYAGRRNHTPFATHALINDFYNKSAFRIIGGSSVVAEALAEVISQRGGQVLTQQKVVSIDCDDSKATAVVTATGQRYEADLVVSAIHPSSTIGLVDSRLLRPSYRKRLEEVHNTPGAFTVYLRFKPDTVPYMNHNLYCYRGDTTWNCHEYREEEWPRSLLYMHVCQQDQAQYAQSGEIMTYMDFDEVRPWVGTTSGNRGADYEAFKQRKAEAVIAALEEEIPGIRNQIDQYYTSTPLTYYDYTGTPEGAMYGVAKDVDILGSGTISSRTRIPNLLLTGQSITCHGMLGVLAGSLMTCAEVLTLDDIINQVKSAN